MSAFQSLRKATLSDVPYIIELEARPENTYVHAYDETTHIAHLNDSEAYYFIGESADAERLGYAILFENDTGVIEWRRIIVGQPGKGAGTAFMQAVIDHFIALNRTKIWLDVYPENTRARRVYGKLGFVEVGEAPNPKNPSRRLIIMERLL